ncbi:MAG: hypothetical protein JWO84_386 [Parcubacteria group bacterium]|nr:hypothetical protein [Parcubacteria group bacterium]
MISRLLFVASAALMLSACEKHAVTPAVSEPMDQVSVADRELHQLPPLQQMAERSIHYAVNPAPLDARSKPCIYVVKPQSYGYYDAGMLYSDGSNYAGSALAYLGRTGSIVKVATNNMRHQVRPEEAPLAWDEPGTVVMYFHETDLDRDYTKTGTATPPISELCKVAKKAGGN